VVITDDSRSAGKETSLLLRNTNFHYSVHKSPTLEPIMSQLNPVHTITTYFLHIRLNVILPSVPGSPKCSFFFLFSGQQSVRWPLTCVTPETAWFRSYRTFLISYILDTHITVSFWWRCAALHCTMTRCYLHNRLNDDVSLFNCHQLQEAAEHSGGLFLPFVCAGLQLTSHERNKELGFIQQTARYCLHCGWHRFVFVPNPRT
jgi:hypothetical protein